LIYLQIYEQLLYVELEFMLESSLYFSCGTTFHIDVIHEHLPLQCIPHVAHWHRKQHDWIQDFRQPWLEHDWTECL